MHLILGSSSPRRKEILGYFSYPFKQCAHPFIEEHISFKGDPIAYTTKIAEEKAEALVSLYPDAVILTADTTVYHQGNILNKPKNEEEAFEMLRSLCGSTHSVFTGVAIRHENKVRSGCEETRVVFRSVSDEHLHLYHSAFHGMDKAGGYGIQNAGSLIVERIEGCFYNVMGLPLGKVQQLLLEFGIDLWRYFIPS